MKARQCEPGSCHRNADRINSGMDESTQEQASKLLASAWQRQRLARGQVGSLRRQTHQHAVGRLFGTCPSADHYETMLLERLGLACVGAGAGAEPGGVQRVKRLAPRAVGAAAAGGRPGKAPGKPKPFELASKYHSSASRCRPNSMRLPSPSAGQPKRTCWWSR